MIDPHAERIAKRLGLTDAVICQLQARGHLQRLAVTPGELDARIYRAYVAHRRERLSRLLVLDPVLEPVDLRLGPGAVARHASGADNGQDGVGVGADIVI